MVIVGTVQAQSAAMQRIVSDSRQVLRKGEFRRFLDGASLECGACLLGRIRPDRQQSLGQPLGHSVPVDALLLQLA
jgi:hypothetical protein